jgi:signal transduction histidine kinase
VTASSASRKHKARVVGNRVRYAVHGEDVKGSSGELIVFTVGYNMHLAAFIQNNHESIVSEWESFARTLLPAAGGMSKVGLRDHAEEILTAVVQDMESQQSETQKSAKSMGQKAAGHLGALGKLHAALRIEDGFTMSQMVAEYRALRASVLRLGKSARPDTEGILRFNEAIDEALTEAVDRYTEKTKNYRDQIIGIVSHDLRNPLGGIILGAAALNRAEGLDDKSARIAARIQSSAKRMKRIVGDLIDLTRGRLGGAIPIVRGPADVGAICQMVISELEGAHPHAVIHYTSKGDLGGEWDADRLAQVLSNLVGNALQHGDPDKPRGVVAEGHGDDVVLAVQNGGTPIPEGDLRDIFEPMVRGEEPGRTSTGLGLGLYIAKELVTAHAGTIDVTSTGTGGTTFTVHLPRHPARGPKAASASNRRDER